MAKFNITYEVLDTDSCEAGETDERGFALESGCLRDAVDAVTSTRTSRVSGVESIEPSCSDIAQARWITVLNGMEYETGAYESRSLHIPESVSGASRVRIARLLGCRV